MRQVAGGLLAIIVAAFSAGGSAAEAAETSSAGAHAESSARLDRLEAEIVAAEDLRDIKKLQRAYGYYLDKGMWEDLAAFFTDDAVANYPAGVFVGHESIRRHLFMNVGAGKLGDIGLGDNRLYDHLNIQPVVHLDAGGLTAKGRWRAFAMFGSFGGGANWAEGVYEVQYAKVGCVWRISKLDYYSGFGAPYATGWVVPANAATPANGVTPVGASDGAGVKPAPPDVATAAKEGGVSEAAVGPGAASSAARPRRVLAHPADRERNRECAGFPAACIAPFHYDNPGTAAGGNVWDGASLLATLNATYDAAGNSTPTSNSTSRSDSSSTTGPSARDVRQRAANLAHRATLLNDEQQIENLQRIYGYYLDRALWDEVTDLFAADGSMELAQHGVYI
ncbi:MAG: nuclear transport factor 2 family protein, partial [Gammaproteobacteria bacterium]